MVWSGVNSHLGRNACAVFLLEGHHVVLFRERLKSGGASLAFRVTEAASRCGSVCYSLYEIDFFDGFKIRRRKG